MLNQIEHPSNSKETCFKLFRIRTI